MKKTIILLLVFLLLLVSAGTAKSASSSLPASIIPENAQWIIHLDMKRFHSTRISDLVNGDQINFFTLVNQRMIKETSINLINDISSITLYGMNQNKRNNVMCLSGNFNKGFILSRLEKAKGYRKDKLGKYTIHKWRDSAFCTFLSDHLLVSSLHPMKESALMDVLNTISGKRSNLMASPLISAINKMPRDAFLIAVADDISALDGDLPTSMILRKTGMVFFVAQEKNENLKLNLKLNTDTPDTAKNIQQIVNGFVALARLKHSEEDDRWKIMENLKIKLLGNVLQFDLVYPSKKLIDMFSHGRHNKIWH